MKRSTLVVSCIGVVASSLFNSDAQAFRKSSYLEKMSAERRETSHPGHVHLTAVRDEKSNIDCLKGCNAVHVPDFFVDRVTEMESSSWLKCVNTCRKGLVKGDEYYEIPVALRSDEGVKKIVFKKSAKDKFDTELAKLNVENLRKRARALKHKLLEKLSLS